MERINVTRSSIPSKDEYFKEIEDLWKTHWLTNMGIKHKQFQADLISFLDTDNIELVVNGHMALEMTLQAFRFPQDSEVITTPFTFASTTHSIIRNGIKPVFCDINENDYVINPELIESLITDKTVAILPVHVYGNICDINAIDKIANKYNLKVIYDAAHTFAETYKGVSTANFGDVSCFSFHATKVFNSIEGGAVCYRSEEIGQRIYDLKNFGIHGENNVTGIGANAKMNEFCAAMGICNLRHVEEEINKRKVVYDRYIENLQNIKGLKLHSIQKDVKFNYAYFPVLVEEKEFEATRDDIYNALIAENIYPRKYFYPLTSEFSCYNGRFDSSNTPIAKYISERIITLPLYADLSLEDVDRISDIIIKLC